MSDQLTSVEEYLEKHAAGKVWGIELLDNLFQTIKKHKAVSAGVGTAAAGLGTLGIFQAMGGDRPGDTMSYQVNKALHSLSDRVRADEQFGEAFAKQLGSSSASELMDATKGVLSKGFQTAQDALSLSPAREGIFETLRAEDADLASADSDTLMEAYNTMSRFAPTLSTDKNAVKSFLRTVATSPEGGTDFNTIKLLAEAENAINPPVRGGR